MVFEGKMTVKETSAKLNINYSVAKYIVRKYKFNQTITKFHAESKKEIQNISNEDR